MTLLFKKSVNIDKIIDTFNQDGCESRSLWKPIHLQPLFKASRSVLNGMSKDLFEGGLCLPSRTEMSRDNVKRVCTLLPQQLFVIGDWLIVYG